MPQLLVSVLSVKIELKLIAKKKIWQNLLVIVTICDYIKC